MVLVTRVLLQMPQQDETPYRHKLGFLNLEHAKIDVQLEQLILRKCGSYSKQFIAQTIWFACYKMHNCKLISQPLVEDPINQVNTIFIFEDGANQFTKSNRMV